MSFTLKITKITWHVSTNDLSSSINACLFGSDYSQLNLFTFIGHKPKLNYGAMPHCISLTQAHEILLLWSKTTTNHFGLNTLINRICVCSFCHTAWQMIYDCGDKLTSGIFIYPDHNHFFCYGGLCGCKQIHFKLPCWFWNTLNYSLSSRFL